MATEGTNNYSCFYDAIDRAVIMAQGGEFAFVLFAIADNQRIAELLLKNKVMNIQLVH